MIGRAVGSVAEEFRRLRGNGRGRILLVVALGWGLTIGGRTVYPALLPQLRTAYGLSLTVAGGLLSVLFITYAVGQLPGGVFADWAGERRTLTLSATVSAAALLFVVLTQSTVALFVATALLGFAVGFYAIARFTAISRTYPEGYGTAIGVSNAAPEVGQAVIPPIAGIVASIAGWRVGFGIVIPVFIFVAVALWLVVPPKSSDRRNASAPTRDTFTHVATAIRRPPVVFGTAAMVIGISVWQAFTGFYPTYLIESKGLSSPAANALFGLYFAATALIHPLSGVIYDRLNVRYTYLPVAVAATALVALPVIESLWALVAVSVLLGGLLGFETSTESYLVAALPAEVEGTGFGVLRTTVFALGSISPVVFGAIADRGWFNELFIALGVATGVSVVIAMRLPPAVGER
ncbi:MAG: MFS transporter [Natronomonas sp.]